jgi:hypothetical protein
MKPPASRGRMIRKPLALWQHKWSAVSGDDPIFQERADEAARFLDPAREVHHMVITDFLIPSPVTRIIDHMSNLTALGSFELDPWVISECINKKAQVAPLRWEIDCAADDPEAQFRFSIGITFHRHNEHGLVIYQVCTFDM